MKKEEETIKVYKELIDIFTKLSNQKDNLFLAEKSKEFVADFANQVTKYENQKSENPSSSEEQTEEITEENKIDPENPIEKEDDEYFNYINNTIRSDSNLKEQLDRLTNKLVEDLKNPTDELIEVWVRNYKDFVLTNYLKEEYMIKYMIGIFEKYDLNRDYINDIEELYEQIELETPDLDSSKKENPEDKKENPEDKKENPEDKKENPEDKKENPEEIKENPEDKKENPEDKKENPEETKENPEETKENERKKVKIHRYVEKKPERSIKIVSTKKAFLNTAEKLGTGVAAIACLSTPIITPAILVAYMIYKLRKNHNYKNHLLEEFLETNGYDIDPRTRELFTINEKGEKVVITTEMLEKAEYSHIKKELMEIGAIKSGFIPEDYKKSKLLQTLMKLNPVRKLKEIKHNYFEKLKAIYNSPNDSNSYLEQQRVKRDLEEIEYYEDEEEMKNGMRGL